MLDQNGLVEVATHACSVILSMYVTLVFTIVANNGIMVIPSLPHGSTKTLLMRNDQSNNWGLIVLVCKTPTNMLPGLPEQMWR